MPRKLSKGEFFARQKAEAWEHARNPAARQEREARAEHANFMTWWKAVNDPLEDKGLNGLPFGDARSWFAERITPDEAVERHLDNLESSQEERSYYDA
jgi:hypothetical protein